MQEKNDFKLFGLDEFGNWLKNLKTKTVIKYIQLHHTEEPSYSNFNGKNHYQLCYEMEQMHIQRGFGGLAQNFTTFPDGLISIGRSIDEKTIGIRGGNDFALNVENIGNFDIDKLTELQSESIIKMTQLLCKKFSIKIDENCVIYHHWFDLDSGERLVNNRKGRTKTCPGNNFFGGNTYQNFKDNLLPLLKETTPRDV